MNLKEDYEALDDEMDTDEKQILQAIIDANKFEVAIGIASMQVVVAGTVKVVRGNSPKRSTTKSRSRAAIAMMQG